MHPAPSEHRSAQSSQYYTGGWDIDLQLIRTVPSAAAGDNLLACCEREARECHKAEGFFVVGRDGGGGGGGSGGAWWRWLHTLKATTGRNKQSGDRRQTSVAGLRHGVKE
jgi:hypothetical protein